MAIQSVFSYKGKAGSLKEAVGAIVQAKTEKLVVVYAERVNTQLKRAAKAWQAWMYQRLGIKGSPFKRNMSPYPMMRTGKLRKTIREPELTTEHYTGPAASRASYALKFKLKGLFGVRPSDDGKLSDVGQHLNDWTDKPFAGWKVRAQRNLYDRMIATIKSPK